MLKKENLDIIFEAGEDLYNYNKSKVLMLEQSTVRIPITRNRKLLSYCSEYCGITGISFNSIRFLSFTGEVNMEMMLNSNFLLKVCHSSDFHLHSMDPLKESLKNLFVSGMNSDVVIRINDTDEVLTHRCMLSSRSPKFNAMFDSGMKESINNVICITCESVEIFKLMIQWLYCGEIKFPKKVMHVFELWKLSDEYFLSDLKEKCEEAIMLKLDESNVVDLMLKFEEYPNISEEVKDKCKTLFIHDFDKVKKFNPDFESQIIKVPGLVTSLFEHIHGKKNKKRRVTFVIEHENVNE